MAQRVQAAVLVEASKIAIRDFDIPDIGRNDGLLEVELAGVCGSDPKMYAGKVIEKYRNFPVIMGHEILGRIAKIGDVAAQEWGVSEGDRVVVEPMTRCGFCSKCITGDYRYCQRQIAYGFVCADTPPHLWGAYAEYMYLASGSLVHRVGDDVPAEAAVAAAAVVADAIRWGRKVGDFGIGDAVVIQGVGQQGLCQVIVAKESGCSPIIATGLSGDGVRFALAKEFGADFVIDVEKVDVVDRVRDLTGGQMADVVVDVTGSAKSLPISLDLTKSQGTLVLPSVTGGQVAPVVQDDFVTRDVKIAGVFTADYQAVRKAIRLVESRKYPIEKLVTHSFSLEETERAVNTTGGRYDGVNPVKVVVRPNGSTHR